VVAQVITVVVPLGNAARRDDRVHAQGERARPEDYGRSEERPRRLQHPLLEVDARDANRLHVDEDRAGE
jgi:hypothetical protein